MKRRQTMMKVFLTVFCGGAIGSSALAQGSLQPAQEAFKEGNEMRAWQLFSELSRSREIAGDQLSPDFAVWVARQYALQRRFDDALELCDEVLANEDALGAETAAEALLLRGDILRESGNIAAARLAYQGLARHGDYRETAAGRNAEFRVVDVLRRVKDYNTALDMLERLKDHPDDDRQAEAYYHGARIAFAQGFYDEARDYLEEVKRRKTDHIEAIFLEAELDLRQDRLHDPNLEIGSRVLTAYIVPGRPLSMRMSDRNLAVVRGGAGIPVDIMTSEGGDLERVNLLPSPRDATLFRANVNTELAKATPTNLNLEVIGSDIVTYKIADAFQQANDLNYPPKQLLVVSDAELTVTSGDFLPQNMREEELLRRRAQHARLARGEEIPAHERLRDTRVVRPGNPVRIQVIDPDQSVSPGRDNVFVNAVASSGNTIEGIELLETAPYTGIFQGELPTRTAPPKALASSSAEGSRPDDAIREDASDGWVSASGQEGPIWFEVDMMSVQTIRELDVKTGGAISEDTPISMRIASEDKTLSLSWPRALPDSQAYGYVDLAGHFGDIRHSAAYLYTEIRSETEQEAVLKIGSCDGVTLWLNGERVHSNPSGRAWQPEQDEIPVRLKPGGNGLLMKVFQLTGPWGASLTVLDSNGGPLPGVPDNTPARPGVVTKWHLFDRPTSENIEVTEKVDVQRTVRIQGKTYRWVPRDVTPPAYLARDGELLKTVFNRPVGVRTVRWTFDAAIQQAQIGAVRMVNTFGETVLPLKAGTAGQDRDRILELAPGDKIDFSYQDKRRIRQDEIVGAGMHSAFYDAEVMFAYETIGQDEQGERVITYDPAVRYRYGDTGSLVIRVVDYDRDVSAGEDSVSVLVRNSAGDEIWIEAIESRPHSGEFIAILRLADALGEDTIRTGSGIDLSLHYQDSENTDGRTERIAEAEEAGDHPPEVILMQSIILRDTEGLVDERRKDLARVQVPIGRDPGEPVVTSLDTNLYFRVVYPSAALSENAIYNAYAVTERKKAEAAAAGVEPDAIEVPMRLADSVSGEFEAEVELHVGSAETLVFEPQVVDSSGRDPGDPNYRPPPPVLAVRPDDIVRITAPSMDGETVSEDRFALASDAVLQFTDSRYEEPKTHMHLGDYLYIQVSDRDRDRSEEIDTLRIILETGADRREVDLIETMPHSGIFARRFLTRARSETATEAEVPEDGSARRDKIEVNYGDTIKAFYTDEIRVSGPGARKLEATMRVYPGADAELATFTKRFSDESIAVRTRLLTAEALFELAKHHRATGQEDLAADEIAEGKAILEEAIEEFPHTEHAPHAEFLLANLAQEIEQFDVALTRYNRVLSHWPDSEYAPRSQLRKAICLEALGDEDNALDAYVELTFMYPSSELVSDAVVRMGQYFYRVERFDVAASVFASFYDNNEANPLAPKALFLSAQSYLRAADARRELLEGEYDRQAREWLDMAISRYEQLLQSIDDQDLRAESMYWLADVYMRINDLKNAYQNFTRLTWDYPESRWARFARGQLVQNATRFERYKND